MNNNELGSSTLVIVTIDHSGNTLKASYIGDSGYLILREKNEEKNKFDIFFKSQEQTHGFNFPYQLGTNGTGGDHPNTALVNEHLVEKNDLVILCTDGLLDNLFSEWVVEIVQDFFEKNENFCAKKLAEKLGEVAFKISLNTKIMTPFSLSAKRHNHNFIGGKSDDITVVVARIEDEHN